MKKALLFISSTLFFLQIPDLSFAQWNYDNQFTPIKEVSVEPYANVQDIKGQDPSLCLGLAVSGGGSRAQYFGTGVLMELSELKNENRSKTFLSEVDYYSSVSGGTFAIAYYMMVRNNGLVDRVSYSEYWKSSIPYSDDGLQSYPDVYAGKLAAFRLWFYERHRRYSGSYAKKIDYDLLKANSKRDAIKKTVPRMFLSDFFVPKCDTCKAKLPMFVSNTTLYPNCERLPLMPHILGDLKVDRSVIPSYKFQDSLGYSFPLAFAVASSSAVPGILPIQKLGVSNTFLTLRAMDGGVVDNLGYETLFELLMSDKSSVTKKKMLIIDCSGIGSQNRYTYPGDHVKMFPLLENSSFFTVASKNLVAKKTIDRMEGENKVPLENDVVLGMADIRERLRSAPKTEEDVKKIKEYKSRWYPKGKIKDKAFNQMYRELAHTFCFKTGKKDPRVFISRDLESSKLATASNFQKLLIYEMASQVITKVRVGDWEQEILMLAGRLLVLENKNEIIKLLE